MAKVEDFAVPAGQSLRKVRDFAKRYNFDGFIRQAVPNFFGTDITDALIECGLIEHDGEVPGHVHYKLTKHGGQLANLHLIKRIDRKEAEAMIAGFLERVKAVNSNPELLLDVGKVVAFGSFAAGADDLGDIDLAIEYRRRPLPPGKGWTDANIERARAKLGRATNNESFFGEREVRLLLKARNPYLSLHGIHQLDDLDDGPRRVLFEAGTTRSRA
jgi:hypothetical protein